MKKLCALLLVCVSLTLAKAEVSGKAQSGAKATFYSDKVVSLYFDKGDTKQVGRLLPTNAFEVLKTEGDKMLLRISGYVNPQAPSVLYFNDSQRIMVAAFGKNNPPKLLNVIKGENGKWDKASIEVWADKTDFATDDKEMLARAKATYMENCGICHTAHKESEFTANQWPATFKGMVIRTGIDKEMQWLIIEYLQKNSKDFKKGGK